MNLPLLLTYHADDDTHSYIKGNLITDTGFGRQTTRHET